MKYRNVGKAGIKVSEISVGSWMTELNSPEKVTVANEVIHQAFESGVNFFDCADAYGNGEAEKFLGKALASFERSKYVVSSKVFFPTGDGVNERGLSRKHIFENAERSLKNMQLDYIDLYYCHRYDDDTPLEETLQALSDLVGQGKILYYGVSEGWSGAKLEEAQRIISEKSLYPMTVVQPQYNMVDRYIEEEIVDICEKYGIGITPFSPLAQGLLTGKYKKGQPLPKGSRATHQADKQINNLLTDINLDRVVKLEKLASELGISVSVLSLAWILRKDIISSVIVGATSVEQLQTNVTASGICLPEQVIAEVDKIFDYQSVKRSVG